MSVSAFGLISDARARQRRRQIGIVAAMISGVGGGLALTRSGIPNIGSPAITSAQSVAPAAILASAPSMGVACYRHSCDWIGLAVWLRRPALAVTATVAGQPVRLQPSSAYPQRVTSIHLETAPGGPTSWNGEAPVPSVQLRIRSSSGVTLDTRLHVPVQPGWG
jgi:hypothetical protein